MVWHRSSSMLRHGFSPTGSSWEPKVTKGLGSVATSKSRVPWPYIALGIEAALQNGVVRRRDLGEIRRRGIGELRVALVGGKPEGNPQAAAVVNAETPGRIGQCEALVASGFECALLVQCGTSQKLRRDRFTQGAVVKLRSGHTWNRTGHCAHTFINFQADLKGSLAGTAVSRRRRRTRRLRPAVAPGVARKAKGSGVSARFSASGSTDAGAPARP